MPGAISEPFDVVVVPFPFTDRASSKRRPAVVISTQAFNEIHGQLVLVMVTSAKGGDWPSDVPLTDWSGAGLTTACRVRLKIFTLDRALIVRQAGRLGAEDRAKVAVALTTSLALR